MHLGVAVDTGDNAGGLLCKCKARCMDEVATDVQEGATAALDMVADAGRVSVEVAEEAEDRAEFSDAAFIKQFAEAEPLGVAANHEGFANLDAGTCLDGKKRFGLGDGEAEGFLAENVLAGFRSFDGPRDVKLIGKRIVDDVDIRVGEEIFVRAVGRWDAEGGCCFPGLREMAGCDGCDA